MERSVELNLDDLRVEAADLAPPPTRSPRRLPFDALSPSEFEWVVALLLSQSRSPVLHLYGRSGQAQGGLDIYEETTQGQSIAYQAKRYRNLSVPQIEEAVQLYATQLESPSTSELPAADAFVLVTSAPIDSDARKVDAIVRLRQKYRGRFDFSVWGQETLSLKLRSMPLVVEAGFGAAWAAQFCGQGAARKSRNQSQKAQRFDRAVRDLVAVQFARDNEIRFRQVDLSGVTVDSMFIDVPVKASERSAAHLLVAELSPPKPRAPGGRPRSVGAAQLLLHPKWTGNAVVVGGPGQGKTTLLQYVTQFYRARLLQKPEYLASTADLIHVTVIKRTPIKIDLPEFAEWRRSNKQTHGQDGAKGRQRRRGTLEFYLCEIIAEQSQTDFTVEDLAHFLARTPLMLALDSLDEVANARMREIVSDEIREAAARFMAAGVDVQIIVASRPGLVGRPLWRDSEFQTLLLQQLTPPLRMKYLERWTSQTRLDAREVRELRETFTKSITVPHVAELAGNPMQLAILLHLMQRRTVLPQKRTALYERYIDIFFDREAKFAIVSENRETLVAFHKLLAWRIHTAVERGESTGAVKLRDLKQVLSEYLLPRGLDSAFVEELFASVTDRVLCLVQREMDSDEFAFEVQPLREFFAAQHIYDQAPSNTPNNTRGACIGALATRPYWQNVLRFLAGNLVSGEVPGIPYALRQILEDQKFGYHPLPRDIAKLLLDDLVFSGQIEIAVGDVVDLILRGQGVYFVSDGLLTSARDGLRFGDPRAAKLAATNLRARASAADNVAELVCIAAILNGMGAPGLTEVWRARRDVTDFSLWARGAIALDDAPSLLEAPDLENRLVDLDDGRLAAMLVETINLRCHRRDLEARVLHEVMTGEVDAFVSGAVADSHNLLSLASRDALGLRQPRASSDASCAIHSTYEAHQETRLLKVRRQLCDYALTLDSRTTNDSHLDLPEYAAVWGEDCWPLRSQILSVAIVRERPVSQNGRIRRGSSTTELSRWFAEARAYGGELQWWVLEAEHIANDDSLSAMTYVCSAFSFATNSVLRWNQRSLERSLAVLSDGQFATIANVIRRVSRESPLARDLNVTITVNAGSSPSRLAVLLWIAGNTRTRDHVGAHMTSNLVAFWPYDGAIRQALLEFLASTRDVLPVELFRDSRGSVPDGTLSTRNVAKLLMGEAEEILRRPDEWPADLTRLAAERIGTRLAGQAPVSEIAASNGWGI
ncbi:hypothetical protein NOCA2150107 [metagenome]|uniref:Restriction endonuclease type IV Mrr domain-containing protein n=1 Tax=metagenome TaxID=256318 RepID=A0A2P2BX82_9ZZZZ